MKRLMVLGCAAAAAMFMGVDTASAQCGYGGYGGGFYGGPGLSIGYSSFAPRSTFSIGYSSFPGYSYRSNFRTRGLYNPTGVYRYRSRYNVPGHYHIQRGRFRW